ncbi:MAG TPA: hypothetical protein V6C81_14000 [Planktothrix sp.]|jgi:hypothetical protein
MTKRYTAPTKALLAIAFAAGLIGAPVLASDESPSGSINAIRKIATNDAASPHVRAYCLLRLAQRYMRGGDFSAAESSYLSGESSRRNLVDSREWKWASWHMNGLASTRNGKIERKVDGNNALKSQHADLALARKALVEAVKQLDAPDDVFVRYNLYYSAWRLNEAIGAGGEARHCKRVLNEFLRSCERGPVNEDKLEVATTILGVMSYGIVPVVVPDSGWITPRIVSTASKVDASDSDFKRSEQLMLRSVAIADRLDGQSQVRRLAHRNLALWYAQVGKPELAEEQKQILFGLVGIKDDSILYPQSAGCGSEPIWWHVEKIAVVRFCGMG